MARQLLAVILGELPSRGAQRVEAYPKRVLATDREAGSTLAEGDLWNGPEKLFRNQGFRVLRDDPLRPVLALDF